MMLTLDVGCGSRSQGDVNIDLLVEESDRHEFDVHTIPNLVVADARSLPFQDHSFSKVTCFHLMEHIMEDQQVYEELNRVANGEIEIRVPLGIWEDIMVTLFFWKDLKKWRQTHHIRRYTKRNLRESLKKVFAKKKMRIVYGYINVFQALRFAFLFLFRSSPPTTQKLNRQTWFPFPFPFEIVANIGRVRLSEQTKLSVIIMTRNEEDNIGRMLDSIVAQDFKGDFEVMVVDADSKDRTREIIMSYSLHLPIRIIDGSGRGIGSDRNIGGHHAKGNVLVFTEGDCFFRSGLFEHLAETFSSDPSVVSWSSCAFPLHSPWYVVLTYKFYDVARYLLTRLRLGFSISAAIIVVRKRIFDRIGGFPTSTDMNDDGIFGRAIYEVCWRRGRYVFSIDPRYSIIRRMNRFETGYFQALDHYLYVITNYIPQLKYLLRNKMIADGRKFTSEN